MRYFARAAGFAWVTVLLGSLTGPVLAADDGDDPQYEEEIVVVASRLARPLLETAASVTVIDAAALDARLALNIGEAVRYEPAISVPRDGTRFGSSGYRVRGIGGNRVLVLVDDISLADEFAVGSYSSGDRDQVDLSLVKSIEILRGPASAVYGSDALGGVVAYKLLTPDALCPAGLCTQSRLGFDSSNDAFDARLRAGFAGDQVSGLIGISARRGNETDAAAVATADRQATRSQAALARLYLDSAAGARWTATVEHRDHDTDTDVRSFLGSGRFRNTTLLQGDDRESRSRVALGWGRTADGSQRGVRGYWQRTRVEQLTLEERPSRDERHNRRFDYLVRTAGVQLQASDTLVGTTVEHLLSYGLDASRSRIEESRYAEQAAFDGSGASNVVLGEVFPLRDFPVTEVDRVGAYIVDEIQRPGSRWTLMPALRFDYHDLAPHPDSVFAADPAAVTVVRTVERSLTPRLGVLFEWTPSVTGYLQYSQGFRAAPFADANLSFEIAQFNYRAIPNPDLKSERSRAVELGLRQRNADRRFDFALHYNRVNDLIQSRINLGSDPLTGVTLFQSRNIGKAEIYGAELHWSESLARFGRPFDPWSVQLSAAWTRGEDRRSGQPLNDIDPAQAVLGLRWMPAAGRFGGELLGTFTQRVKRVDDPNGTLFRPAGSALFDLLGFARVGAHTTVRVGVFNLTDRTAWPWSAVEGRSSADSLLNNLSLPGRSFTIALHADW